MIVCTVIADKRQTKPGNIFKNDILRYFWKLKFTSVWSEYSSKGFNNKALPFSYTIVIHIRVLYIWIKNQSYSYILNANFYITVYLLLFEGFFCVVSWLFISLSFGISDIKHTLSPKIQEIPNTEVCWDIKCVTYHMQICVKINHLKIITNLQ